MTTPAAPPALPITNPLDFSDRLSPIIVKELRQGLRTKVFVSLFIIVQALMSLTIIISLVAAANQIDASTGSSFFWMMIGIPVVFILPFRGFNSVGAEMKGGTLDLVLLTRLSARRIVFGKWLAIVAQTALFVCAVLPYVVLRYFLGGVNLTDELIGLVWMLFSSAILTAVAVGMSPYQNRVTRVLFWLGIIFLAQASFPLLLFLGFGNTAVLAGGAALDWTLWAVLPAFGILLLLLMLEVGASKIAPEAENHSAGIRLIAALLLLIAALFTVLDSSIAIGVTIAAFAIGYLVLAASLAERVRLNAGLYRPFAERGILGRLAGRLLSPGWPSGTLFSLVFTATTAILLSRLGVFSTNEITATFLAAVGALLLPAALIRAFLPNTKRFLTYYVSVQIVGIVVALVVMILDSIFDSFAIEIIAFFPTSGLMVALFTQFRDSDPLVLCVSYGVIIALSAGMLLERSRSAWAEIRKLERSTPAASTPEGSTP